MNATPSPTTSSSSRRALLAGAIGGLGALAASAIGRPQVAQAHDVDDVGLGLLNLSNFETRITNGGDSTTVFTATNTHGGIALHGNSASGYGAFGESASGTGVVGASDSNVGVYGISGSTGFAAVIGRSDGNGTGVEGYSGFSPAPAGPAKTGVYGYAVQDGSSKGVWGRTTAGHAIHGTATSGYAGYFAGKVYTSSFHEMTEITAPGAPANNKGRLFMRDNGSGKTQLCVRFNTGGVLVLATQP
jgi:hypothetical protein